MEKLTEYKRDSFVFYRSFFEAIELLDNQQSLNLIKAIGEYALNGQEIELEGVEKIVWTTIKPQLEANRKKYENGKKGGAPKGSRNNPNGRRGKAVQEAPEPNEELSSTTPPQTQYQTPIYPNFNEVSEYIKKESLLVQPDTFFNYYQARGWRTGTTTITDWKALLRSWHIKESIKYTDQPVKSSLGTGEMIKDGVRTYGTGGLIVPFDAPPRPGNGFWWNTATNSWDNTI